MRWTPCFDDARVVTMAAEMAILCVLFEEFLESDEIGINTCLILQNTLNVTVTALAVNNKIEHPNKVKGFVETLVPNYCDPTFGSHFRMKINLRWRIIHFLPPRQCYDLYDLNIFLLWVLGLSLLLITVVVLWYCNIYHYIIKRSIEKFMKVSLHNTIAKYINMYSILCYINQCLAHLPKERIWTRKHCNYYMLFRHTCALIISSSSSCWYAMLL